MMPTPTTGTDAPTMIDVLRKELRAYDERIDCAALPPSSIEFEERVKLLCFHCKNYGHKFTCPPRIPAVDYRRIINVEYTSCAVVYTHMQFTDATYEEVRNASTNMIHRALLRLEKVLFEHGVTTPMSLIGGSCKLCKSGCSSEKCNNPYHSRIPMEAAGINVVSTVKKVGIEIRFPVKTSLYRCGIILW